MNTRASFSLPGHLPHSACWISDKVRLLICSTLLFLEIFFLLFSEIFFSDRKFI